MRDGRNTKLLSLDTHKYKTTFTSTTKIVPRFSSRCGDKTILVKKEGALIYPEVDESNYVRVETMHPSIAKYRTLYVDDLSQCLGLNESRLKPE
jgi:hypothetical protein